MQNNQILWKSYKNFILFFLLKNLFVSYNPNMKYENFRTLWVILKKISVKVNFWTTSLTYFIYYLFPCHTQYTQFICVLCLKFFKLLKYSLKISNVFFYSFFLTFSIESVLSRENGKGFKVFFTSGAAYSDYNDSVI